MHCLHCLCRLPHGGGSTFVFEAQPDVVVRFRHTEMLFSRSAVIGGHRPRPPSSASDLTCKVAGILGGLSGRV